MTVDEISDLSPRANLLQVPWLSPRPSNGDRLSRDRETTKVEPPEPAPTLSRWPRVFPGL
jgi:hypothetical protein